MAEELNKNKKAQPIVTEQVIGTDDNNEALEKAKTVENQNICFIVCDFCERYVSCDLFL